MDGAINQALHVVELCGSIYLWVIGPGSLHPVPQGIRHARLVAGEPYLSKPNVKVTFPRIFRCSMGVLKMLPTCMCIVEHTSNLMQRFWMCDANVFLGICELWSPMLHTCIELFHEFTPKIGDQLQLAGFVAYSFFARLVFTKWCHSFFLYIFKLPWKKMLREDYLFLLYGCGYTTIIGRMSFAYWMTSDGGRRGWGWNPRISVH
jgi:hypothetical protein